MTTCSRFATLSAALAALACLVAPVATQEVVGHAQQACEQLARKSKKHQQTIATELEDASLALTGAYFTAMRSIIDDGEGRRAAKPKKTKARKAKKRAPKSGTASWQLPHTVSYSFGHAAVEPLAGKRSDRDRAARRVPVELALMGMLPGCDLALAEIEARLDSDRSADSFGAFLDSWKNGDETFYESLDRTAGTGDSVFYFDAMLSQFVSKIADRKHPSTKQLRKSHDAAHDALHRAFLSYRQYRGFREAVAMAMVLPPDIPFPAHLHRYEAKVAGAYSLREQVLMVLAAYDDDPMVVVDLIVSSAEPMPVPLWSDHYDPYGAWRSVFEVAMDRMLQQADHTDTFLAEARLSRMQQVGRVRAMACEVVGVKPMSARY